MNDFLLKTNLIVENEIMINLFEKCHYFSQVDMEECTYRRLPKKKREKFEVYNLIFKKKFFRKTINLLGC